MGVLFLPDAISPDSSSGLCAICDSAVEDWEEHDVVLVHGGKYLVHSICMEADDDDENEARQ